MPNTSLTQEKSVLGAILFEADDLIKLISQYLEAQELFQFILVRSDLFDVITKENPQVIMKMYEHLYEKKMNRDYDDIWADLKKDTYVLRNLIPLNFRDPNDINAVKQMAWDLLKFSTLGALGAGFVTFNILDTLFSEILQGKYRFTFLHKGLRIDGNKEIEKKYNHLKEQYKDILNLPELSIFLEPNDLAISFLPIYQLKQGTRNIAEFIDEAKISLENYNKEVLKEPAQIEEKKSLTEDLAQANEDLQINLQKQTRIIHTLFFGKSKTIQNNQQNHNFSNRL
jgi:hypothetical protein